MRAVYGLPMFVGKHRYVNVRPEHVFYIASIGHGVKRWTFPRYHSRLRGIHTELRHKNTATFL